MAWSGGQSITSRGQPYDTTLRCRRQWSAAAIGVGQGLDLFRQGGAVPAGAHPPAPVALRHAGDVDAALAAKAQVILHLGHKQLRHAALSAPQQGFAHMKTQGELHRLHW